MVWISGSGSPYFSSKVLMTSLICGSSQPSISAMVVPVPSMPFFHRPPTL
jgi:hypothetical protein